MSEHVRWLIGTAIALVGLIIALLAWQDPKAAVPATSSTSAAVSGSPGTSPDAAPQNIDYTDVRAGECLAGSGIAKDINNTNSNTFPDSVEVVPCDVSHIAEVLFAGDDLSASQANNQVNTICDNAFKTYIGISLDDSIYTWQSDSIQVSSGYFLDCLAYYQTSGKPGYKDLDRSLKGIRQ
jgi:hypothetical protein